MRRAILLLSALPAWAGAWQWPWSSSPPDRPFKSVLGWEGEKYPALAYEDGSFFVGDGLGERVGFKVSRGGESPRWHSDSGYLPCLVTELEKGGLSVKVSEFADKVTVRGDDYIVAYARVTLTNRKTHDVWPDPGASRPLVVLSSAEYLAPGQSADYDYAVELDRFGRSSPRLSAADLRALGGWDEHFSRMRRHWDEELSGIVQLRTSRPDLDDSYKAGYIDTQIVKESRDPKSGAQDYARVYDHDAGGIFSGYQQARELLAAIVRESSDGRFTIGRGIPDEWLESGRPLEVRNLPISGGRRIGVRIVKAADGVYELSLSGDALTGPVSLELPVFSRKKIVLATAGSVPDSGDRVELGASTRQVQVTAR